MENIDKINEKISNKAVVEVHVWNEKTKEYDKESVLTAQDVTRVNVGENSKGKFIQLFRGGEANE